MAGDINKAARDIENVNVSMADAEKSLLKEMDGLSPAQQLKFVKDVAQKTQADHAANSSLPYLEITDPAGVNVQRTIPSYLQRAANHMSGGIWHNTKEAADYITSGREEEDLRRK